MEYGAEPAADFGRRGFRRGSAGPSNDNERSFGGRGRSQEGGDFNRSNVDESREFRGGRGRGGFGNRGGFNDADGGFGDRNGSNDRRGGFNNRGGFNDGGFNNRGGFNDRRGGFSNRGGSSDAGEGFNNRGGFNDRRGGFGNRGDSSDRGGGGFGNRGGFSDRGGGFGNQGGFSDRGGFGNRGGFSDRGGGFGNRGGFSDRGGGFGGGGRGGYGNRDVNGSDGERQGAGIGSNRGGGPVQVGVKAIPWASLRENLAKAQFEPWAKEPPIQKNFYKEADEIASMTPEERKAALLEMNDITVQDLKEESSAKRSIPNPVKLFEHAWSPYPGILSEIHKNGFKYPTPIQCQAWPVLLQGMDFIGIAQTGTGKTLAFLLPAFVHIEGQLRPRPERNGPTVLVLSPTRELALQIQGEVEKYAYMGIRCVCVYGGGSRRDQCAKVERGVEIVVATPGRLNDIVNSGILNLFHVSYLVLDEADRMLDMGFEPQIIRAISKIRPDRQTVMTSATWPSGVRRIAEKYMTDPVQCYVGSLDLAAVHSVTQYIEIVDEEEKRPRILRFVSEEMQPEDKVLIFVSRKIYADQLASEMTVCGIDAEAIHGDREQYDRENALRMFRSSEVRILIATDLASRGLDVKDVTHVINMDMPKNMEEYVHRVGRTGRAGATGSALTFVTRQDWTKVGELIKILEEANQEVSDELRRMAERWERKKAEGPTFGRGGGGGGGSRRGRGRDDFASGVVF